MKTAGKKLLGLMLVIILAMTALTVTAFADPTCTTDATHTLTHHAYASSSSTADGNVAYWECAECHKNYDAAGNVLSNVVLHYLEDQTGTAATCTTAGKADYKECSNCHALFTAEGNPTTVEALAIPASHTKVLRDALAADCGTGTDGYEAYYECTACHSLFKEDGTLITAKVPVAPVHKDVDPKDGTCDVCGKTTECVITFEVLREKSGGGYDVVTLTTSTKKVKQGEKMGDPVAAPAPPKGFAYDRLNSSCWKLVDASDNISDTSPTYNKDNVVTVGTAAMKYRAIQKALTMNLIVAFRLDGVEHTYCTFKVPYFDTVDASGKGIPVHDYLLTHNTSGAESTNSIDKTFRAAFADKNVTTITGANVDLTGYKWENDQKFLSATTNKAIDSLALTMNMNFGASNSDIKVYAKLTAQTSFELTFSPMSPYSPLPPYHTNDPVQGTFGKRTVTYNSVLSNMPTPTCSGYIFMGWYDEPQKGELTYNKGNVTLPTDNSSAKKYINGTQYTVRGNTTLYPYWIKEVDAWVVVHNSKSAEYSSLAKIKGIKPTDAIAKTTVLANVDGYTAGNYIGPIQYDSATGFNNWDDATMAGSVVTTAGQSYYFHVYAPGATARSVTPAANSGANNGYGGSGTGSNSSATYDPSNPKTGDVAANGLNVAVFALTFSALGLAGAYGVCRKRRYSM